jgi:tRNA-specific 2-thiouridylase
MPHKVLALISGGVDSSTAAASLVQQGFEVVGITMKVWKEPEYVDDAGRRRCSTSEIEDARKVCALLNIPHHVSNRKTAFRKYVVEPFCEEYLAGRTPNPCVVCNTDIKFRLMLHRARALGAEYIATGHYARIQYDNASGRFLLLKGRDTAKDQSYFLHRLTQSQLKRILFPLGEQTKEQIRRRARELKLPVAEKAESQEICFVPDGDYRGLLERLMPGRLSTGPIVDVEGTELGTHKGIANYTIGQRRGLGVAHPRPLYVIGFDIKKNAVIVGISERLWSHELVAERVNWISTAKTREPFRAHARIRYKHKESPATITPLGRGAAHVRFEDPQRAITPGQSVVFYDGDLVLGGGIIGNIDEEDRSP